MLKFMNIKEGNAVAYDMGKCIGVPPFIFKGLPFDRYVNYQAGDWNGAMKIAYHSSTSPIEYECYIKGFIADFLLAHRNDDFIWHYDTDNPTFKDYQNVKALYDDSIKRQVDQVIKTLNYDKVLTDQKQEFFKGLRMFSVAPSVALQICLSCYEFDRWDINWGDPRTYWNGIKEVIGVAGNFIP